MKRSIYNSLIMIASIIIGMLFFAFYHHWIIIQLPWTTYSYESSNPKLGTKQTLTIYFFDGAQEKTEPKELVWSDDEQMNLTYLVRSWLTMLYEENITPRKILLITTIINPHTHEALISFDRSLFPKEFSLHTKYLLIESLLKTIRQSSLSVTSVRFLAHHEPMTDQHLSFLTPWPITGFKDEPRITIPASNNKKDITIMFDPAGDINTPGRMLGNYTEQSLAVNIAKILKKQLEHDHSSLTVLLSHDSNESVMPITKANDSNIKPVDLFIHLTLNQTTSKTFSLGIYHYLTNQKDFLDTRNNNELVLTPYTYAHLGNVMVNAYLTRTLAQNHPEITTHAAMPLKPLVGITAPALVIEIGLANVDVWPDLIPLLNTIINEATTLL
jgi:N-acetylmuramoyl-L-alanine amidase